MDAEIIVAIVALGAAYVAFRQAREAARAREAAERQAAAAEAEVAEAREANQLAQQQLGELREERQERSRVEQRDAVLAVLSAGREWATQADIVLVPMMLAHPLKLAGKQSTEPYGDATQQFSAALVRCQYVVTDPDLATIFEELVAKRFELTGIVKQLLDTGRHENGRVGAGLTTTRSTSRQYRTTLRRFTAWLWNVSGSEQRCLSPVPMAVTRAEQDMGDAVVWSAIASSATAVAVVVAGIAGRQAKATENKPTPPLSSGMSDGSTSRWPPTPISQKTWNTLRTTNRCVCMPAALAGPASSTRGLPTARHPLPGDILNNSAAIHFVS